MHFHDNSTDTQTRTRSKPQQYYTTEELSDTARSTFGFYEPNMYYEDDTSNHHVSISSNPVQSSATSSEMKDAATTLPAESLLLSSNAGREPERHPVQKRRLLTNEIPNVLEGEIRVARRVSAYYRRQGFEALHPKNDSLKRPLLVIDGQPKDFYKPRQQELPRRQFPKCTLVCADLTTSSKLSLMKYNEFTFMNPQSNEHKHSKRNATRSSRRISSKRCYISGNVVNSGI